VVVGSCVSVLPTGDDVPLEFAPIADIADAKAI
jgi:hypothetical protein